MYPDIEFLKKYSRDVLIAEMLRPYALSNTERNYMSAIEKAERLIEEITEFVRRYG